MIKFLKASAGLASLFILFNLLPAPNAETVSSKIHNPGAISVATGIPIIDNIDSYDSINASDPVDHITGRRMVVPGGCPFGIKMHTRGVIIVGMSDIQAGPENLNPAKEAGLRTGDIITFIEDTEITRNSDAKKFIAESGGYETKITVSRGDEELEFYLKPVESELGGYKAGMWIRDSSAGIGTLTYYDPGTLAFGGLGHAICDIDTGRIMPLFSGEIVDVNISGINAGQSGRPGELKGSFASDAPLGQLYHNSEYGIFGVLDYPVINAEPVPMALKHEIKPGPATIFATVSGHNPREFDIMIEKINYAGQNPTKNMIIRVVDSELLGMSGGIVQGMSGSPVIQDGMLVGAITHVFVNDPARGYGIFAENMDKILNSVECGQVVAQTY